MHVELEFTPESLDAIAELALLRGTGARGSSRDHGMQCCLAVMYEVPSRSDIAKVIVTPECNHRWRNPDLCAAHGRYSKAGCSTRKACRREERII